MRTPYVSPTDAASVCREVAELVPDVPALSPFRPRVLTSSVPSPIAVTEPRPVTG